MNLQQAKDIAARFSAFGIGALVTLPSNAEIRELVEFIRAVLPIDRFDPALLAALNTEPFRFDASLAIRLREQFDLANEIIDADPLLKQKVSRESEMPVQSKSQGPTSFVVLASIGYGLIFILSLWRLWHIERYGPWAVMFVFILMSIAIFYGIRKKASRKSSSIDSFDGLDDTVSDVDFSGDYIGGDGD